jgi:hypothetical protein
MRPELAGELEDWREGSTANLDVELRRLGAREPRRLRLLRAVPAAPPL